MSKIKLIYGENAAGKTALFDRLKDLPQYKAISIEDLKIKDNFTIYSKRYTDNADSLMDIILDAFVWQPEDLKTVKPITKTVAKKEIANLFKGLDPIEIIEEVQKYEMENYIFPMRAIIARDQNFMEMLNKAKDENLEKETYTRIIKAIIVDKAGSDFDKKWNIWGGKSVWEGKPTLSEKEIASATYSFLNTLTTAKLAKLKPSDVENWQTSGDTNEWMKFALYSNMAEMKAFDRIFKLIGIIKDSPAPRFSNIAKNIERYGKSKHFDNVELSIKDNYKLQIKGQRLSRGQATLIYLFSEIEASDINKILILDDLLETLDYINWGLVLDILKENETFKEILILTHNIPSVPDDIEIERLNEELIDNNIIPSPAHPISSGNILTPKNAYAFLTGKKDKKVADCNIINLTVRIFMRDIYKMDRISSSFKRYHLGESKKERKNKHHKDWFIGDRLYAYNSDFIHDRKISIESARYFGFSRNYVKKIFAGRKIMESLVFVNSIILEIKKLKARTYGGFSRDDLLLFWEAAAKRITLERAGSKIPKAVSEQVHRLDTSKLTDN